MKVLATVLLVAALMGCASAPTDKEMATADYGAFPQNYKQIVQIYYATALKDPSSVQYREITEPEQRWLGDRITGGRYGYLVCATINAKNSYGAYTGFKTDGFFIRDGRIAIFLDNGLWFGRSRC